MMGGGLCWLDYDNDGWIDLFVVNSYADDDIGAVAARGGLPRSALFHNVQGTFVDVSARVGRGTGRPRRRLRRGRLQRRRLHRPLRDDRDRRRAALEQRRRHLHGGRRAAGDRLLRLALGAAVGGRERRRPARSVRRRATPTGTRRSRARRPASRPTISACATCSSSTRASAPTGARSFREVGEQAGLEPAHVEHGLGAVFTDVNGDGRPDLYVANDEDPNRLYVNDPSPGGPARLPPRRERAQATASPTRTPAWGSRAATTAATGCPTSSSPTPAARPTRSTASDRRAASRLHGRPQRSSHRCSARTSPAGALLGRPQPRRHPRPRRRQRRHPGHEPRQGRRADPGARQPLGAGQDGKFGDAGGLLGLRPGPLVNGRGLAAADFNNDGNVDIAINSIGGPLVLLENTNTSGHWLEVSLDGLPAGRARHRRAARTGAGSSARSMRAAATSRPRTRARSSGSATRRRSPS